MKKSELKSLIKEAMDEIQNGDPDVNVRGYGILKLSYLKEDVIKHLEDLLSRAKDGGWKSVYSLLYKHGVIESKLQSLIEAIDSMGFEVENNLTEAFSSKEEDDLITGSRRNDLQLVKSVIENDITAVHWINDLAVQEAAEAGNLEIVEYLVENGANIHVDADAPFRKAVYKGHLPVVEYLVKKGANFKNDINHLIKVATFNKHDDVVNYLKSIGDMTHNLNEEAFSPEDKSVFDSLSTRLKFPFVKGYISTLGGEDRASYMLTVSTTLRDKWSNGILENSEYGKFRIDKTPQGYVIEHFSGPLPKFRKSTSKTLDELIAKLNAYYTKVTGIK